jgi:hypothetical protein
MRMTHMHYKDPNQNHKMENKFFGAKTFILCSLKSHNTKNETLNNNHFLINPLKHKKIGSMFTLNEVPTKKTTIEN